MQNFIHQLIDNVKGYDDPEFTYDVYRDNTRRMLFLGILIFIADGIYLLVYHDQVSLYDFYFNAVIMAITLFALPIVLLAHYRWKCYTALWYRVFLVIVAIVYMCIGIWFTLELQAQSDRITPFVFSLIAIALVVHVRPLFAFLIIAVLNALFYMLLPYYQMDISVLHAHQFNTIIISIIIAMLYYRIYESKVNNFKQLREIKRSNQKLRELSTRDSLTMLFNHKYGKEQIEEAIYRFERYREPFSILLYDIDDFKHINDRAGHLTGDNVLLCTVHLLLSRIRKSDVPIRYGGDEFMVVFKNTNLHNALRVAEQLRSEINSQCHVDGSPISISGGLVEYSGQTKLEIIDSADRLLYRAKSLGKNRICHE